MLTAFFVLTFALSWVCWFAAGAIWRATATSFSAWGHLGTILYLIGVFAPGIVSLLLTMRREGRVGAENLIGRVAILPAQVRWFVFALGFMAAVKLTAAVIVRYATGAWPGFSEESFLLLLGATVLSTPVQAGEEIGWRGFALPRLAATLGLRPASLLLGGVWACWHLPWFVMPGGDQFGQSFPLYWLQVTSLSVVMAWLYWRTNGSLLIVMVFHAAVNNMKEIVPSALSGGGPPAILGASAVGWATAGLLALCAVYFLARMRGADLLERAPTPTGDAPVTG